MSVGHSADHLEGHSRAAAARQSSTGSSRTSPASMPRASRRELERFCARRHARQRGWIACIKGQAVGYLLAVYVFSLEHLGLTAEIDEFFVLPSARGKGLGDELPGTRGGRIHPARVHERCAPARQGKRSARAFSIARTATTSAPASSCWTRCCPAAHNRVKRITTMATTKAKTRLAEHGDLDADRAALRRVPAVLRKPADSFALALSRRALQAQGIR